MPRMTDRVYLTDDGRCLYHTCGVMPLPAMVNRYFVYSRLDTAIQSVTEMLPLKRGRGVAHRFNCIPPHPQPHEFVISASADTHVFMFSVCAYM